MIEIIGMFVKEHIYKTVVNIEFKFSLHLCERSL